MKSKLISKLLIMPLSILLLTSCGQAANPTSSQTPGTSPVAQTSENTGTPTASAEKVKIEYWHVNAENQGGLSVEKLVSDFNAQSDTVEVVAKFNPDMYKGLMTNLQAEAATGKSPAIVQVGWAMLDYFANNFEYTEPQAVIDANFPNDKTFLSDNFLPNVMDLAKTTDGKQIGIPYSLSTPVLFLNVDLLKQAGLPEDGPKTWDEVRDFSKVVKEKTGKYGFYAQEPADNWAQQSIIESNGASMVTSENGKVKASFASSEGIEAYQMYADMVLVDKTALHMSWDEGVKAFIEGNSAMLYTTIARRANLQSSVQFELNAVNSPTWGNKPRKIPAGGCFLAITAKEDKEKEAAWEFMRYLYSIEGMTEWTIGTGYVPPRKDVADAENGLKQFLAENKMMQAATSQMDGVVSWTSFPGDAGLKAEQMLLDMRDQILSGKKTAESAMTETQDAINAILD